jgi:hypothetical protein
MVTQRNSFGRKRYEKNRRICKIKSIIFKGNPKILVVPNFLHRMDASLYLERYPELKIITPECCLQSAKEKVNVTTTCEAYYKQESINGNKKVIIHQAEGVGKLELCYELRVNGGEKGALVFCDQLFKF